MQKEQQQQQYLMKTVNQVQRCRLPGRRTFGSGLSVCCKYWAKVLKFSSLISMIKKNYLQQNIVTIVLILFFKKIYNHKLDKLSVD